MPATIDPRILWGLACALVGFISLFVFFTLRLPIVGWISSTVLFAVGAILFEVVRANTGGAWNLRLLWLLAPIPGSFWYLIYSKRYVWLSRLIIVFMIGAYTGKAFQEHFSNLLSQLYGTMKPVWISMPGGVFSWDWMQNWIGNIAFVCIAFLVLFYFVFTFRVGDHPMGRRVHTGSRVFMMIAFGIVFGTVVGTRMGLITDRIYFLVEEWAKPIIFSL